MIKGNPYNHRSDGSRHFVVDEEKANFLLSSPMTQDDINLIKSEFDIKYKFEQKAYIVSFILLSFLSLIAWMKTNGYGKGDAVVFDTYLISVGIYHCIIMFVLAFFVTAFLSGKKNPIGLTIDGITFISESYHLSSAKKGVDFMDENFSDLVLTDNAKQFIKQIKQQDRQITVFECNLVYESAKKNRVNDIFSL